MFPQEENGNGDCVPLCILRACRICSIFHFPFAGEGYAIKRFSTCLKYPAHMNQNHTASPPLEITHSLKAAFWTLPVNKNLSVDFCEFSTVLY